MSTVKDLGMTISRNAAVDLSAKVHYLAKVDTTGKFDLASASTDSILGVITEGAAANKPVTVQYGGQSKAIAGGVITAGDRLTADSSGKMVATTTAGNRVIGIALESGTTNDIVPFVFVRMHVAVS